MSSAVATAIARSVVAPFDRVKIISQVSGIQIISKDFHVFLLNLYSNFDRKHKSVDLINTLISLLIICMFTLFQVHYTSISNGQNHLHYHPGIFTTLNQIYREQGLRALWFGNFTNIIRFVPSQVFNIYTIIPHNQILICLFSIN